MEHPEHSRHASGELRRDGSARPDRLRADRFRPLRRIQVILALLLSANEMGVSLAIVRWDGDVRTFARTVFTSASASSTLLYLRSLPLAPELATVFGSPGATGMVRVICLCVSHRWSGLRTAGLAYTYICTAAADAGERPQLHRKHWRNILARILRVGPDQLRLGICGGLHHRADRRDYRGPLLGPARVE